MPADPPFDPDTFSGVGRLFPLPQVAAFPHVVTPLHVFEERYVALTTEALASDGLITMAVLAPGWEPDYAGRPPLSEVGCLGKVISHHKTPEGRYNLLLLGLRRVRLKEELDPPLAYRRSRLELIHEQESTSSVDAESVREQQSLRKQIVSLLQGKIAGGAAAEELAHTLSCTAALGAVADLAAHSLPISSELKLRLLGEGDAVQRCRLLLEAVGAPASDDEPFPPRFSNN
ncbi:Lon protease 2 [Posidoniimonas polymericola]|uniref:Lon protease 2 n=2 Tax=Posidoniimonas polymericola TaxID=2528002 RepID=A0A5C5XYN7_9BACT|nr:Lon protease 2 [Posidoniimonas polymericola]